MSSDRKGGLKQVWQDRDSKGDLGYSVTRLSSLGGMERIEGSSWNFEWSGVTCFRGDDVGSTLFEVGPRFAW